MICAYDKVYLDNARTALARMLDYAVYDLEYSIADFWQMFIMSGAAERFGKGDYSLLAGKSGVEIAREVTEKVTGIPERKAPRYTVNRSPEYWTGWALAYFQWESSLSFEKITKVVPIENIAALYFPYHEMDIRQFCDKMKELYRAAKPDTNLKMLRRQSGLTQRELAEQSNIPIRTIQQYEQRQKDINKAQVEYLIALARVLCCEVEELVERI